MDVLTLILDVSSFSLHETILIKLPDSEIVKRAIKSICNNLNKNSKQVIKISEYCSQHFNYCSATIH
jgi:hypothetical protein